MNLTCNRLILARLWEENEVRSSSQATKKGNKTSGKSGTKLNPHFLTVRFYQVDGQVKTMRILLMFPLQNLSKFLEIPYLLAFSEVERLNAICMNEMPGFQSRVGAPAIKHEFQPFGRLNSCGVSPLQPVLESSALRFFSLQRTKPRSFHKISDKKLVKPIVENSWTFWSQLFIFPQRNQLSGCETHRSPILSTKKKPLVAQNHWARLCISSAPLQSTERDAW